MEKYKRISKDGDILFSSRLNIDELEKIIFLYQNGMSSEKIAPLFNYTSGRIRYILKKNNIKTRNIYDNEKSNKK